jgi:hypothetical protein
MKQIPSTRSATRRDQTAAFLARWERAGRALEHDRARSLRALAPHAARLTTKSLFRLWRPAPRDDGGAGLIRMQQVFRGLRPGRS